MCGVQRDACDGGRRYDVVLQMWLEEAEQRPEFSAIKRFLFELLQDDDSARL